MTDSILSLPPDDLAYWEQYRFHFDRDVRNIVIGGNIFPVVGEYKSRIGDLMPNGESGFIFQEGRISIINPDKTSSIAFLTLESELSLYSFRRHFKPLQPFDRRVVVLDVFPRNPADLQPSYKIVGSDQVPQTPTLIFAEEVLRHVPGAPFEAKMRGDFVQFSGVFLPHVEPLSEALGCVAEGVAEQGLCVFKETPATTGSCRKTLEHFLEASVLSMNPSVRAGFRRLLGRLSGEMQWNPLPKGAPVLGIR